MIAEKVIAIQCEKRYNRSMELRIFILIYYAPNTEITA